MVEIEPRTWSSGLLTILVFESCRVTSKPLSLIIEIVSMITSHFYRNTDRKLHEEKIHSTNLALKM